MAHGFPHRMRFKAFNARYRMLANPISSLSRLEEKAVDDCEIILDCYSRLVKEEDSSVYQNTTNNKDWAHGRKHVFLSEGARQQLENMREVRRQGAARRIQRCWRRWHSRRSESHNNRHQPLNSSQLHFGVSSLMKMTRQRPRPQPISGTPPPSSDPLMVDKCDFKTIQQTCSLFGLDLVNNDLNERIKRASGLEKSIWIEFCSVYLSLLTPRSVWKLEGGNFAYRFLSLLSKKLQMIYSNFCLEVEIRGIF